MAENYKTPEELIALIRDALEYPEMHRETSLWVQARELWGIVAENTREDIARDLDNNGSYPLIHDWRTAAKFVRGEAE